LHIRVNGPSIEPVRASSRPEDPLLLQNDRHIDHLAVHGRHRARACPRLSSRVSPPTYARRRSLRGLKRGIELLRMFDEYDENRVEHGRLLRRRALAGELQEHEIAEILVPKLLFG
jgi:hypothetical protein